MLRHKLDDRKGIKWNKRGNVEHKNHKKKLNVSPRKFLQAAFNFLEVW